MKKIFLQASIIIVFFTLISKPSLCFAFKFNNECNVDGGEVVATTVAVLLTHWATEATKGVIENRDKVMEDAADSCSSTIICANTETFKTSVHNTVKYGKRAYSASYASNFRYLQFWLNAFAPHYEVSLRRNLYTKIDDISCRKALRDSLMGSIRSIYSLFKYVSKYIETTDCAGKACK